MPYCTVTNISNAITAETVKQLTDDAGSGAIDQTKVDAAISSADELMNGFLRAGGYTLPLASTPPMLLDLSVDLAVFNLYARRHFTDVPESVQKKKDNALKLLEKIQKRTILIGADDPAETTAGGGSFKTNKTSESRVFSKETLDTY